MDGAQVVTHCAAALPLCSRNEIFSTNVVGTRIVLESALHNAVSRFIHISSTAVYGIPDHYPIREQDHPRCGSIWRIEDRRRETVRRVSA